MQNVEISRCSADAWNESLGVATSTKMNNVLHASSIKYLKKKEITITETDIENFHRWIEVSNKEYKKDLQLVASTNNGLSNIIAKSVKNMPRRIVPMRFVDRLVTAFAPNVIGWPELKLGLLRSIVGGRKRGEGALSVKFIPS